MIFFFKVSLNLVGQSRYEQFKEYFSDSLRQQNKNFTCIKTYQQKTGDIKHLMKVEYFNAEGLPTTIKQIDDTAEVERNDFTYKDGKLITIEEFQKKNNFLIAEIAYDKDGLVKRVSESVFSSSTNEKLPTHDYNYLYYPNKQLKQIYVFEGEKADTVEIKNFNDKGQQITSFMNYGGLTTKRIEFTWNKDSTESKETHFDNENKAYNTIVSKFKNKLIIQRIDKSTSPTPFYWKYNKLNKVTETNSGTFYIQNYFYNEKGLLIKQTMTIDEKFNYNNFPKTIVATYDYMVRKNSR